MKFSAAIIATTISFALLSAGCQNMPWSRKDDKDKSSAKAAEAPAGKVAEAMIKPSGIASTRPASNVNGTVTFTQKPDGVKVVAQLSGLQPNSRHGIHVHEKGDLIARDLSSAGAHWDPHDTKDHGGPGDANVHAGDLGNIQSDSKGNAHKEWTLKNVSVEGADKPSVVGKSVIVHEKMDDLKSDPSGNSGDRIAGGVIKLQK